jgi:aminotransferase
MQVMYYSLLSDKVRNIPPSGIRKYFDLMENMDNVISLSVGEPDFKTPWHIRDAGIYSLEKGFTKYTSNAGLSDLRREISVYLERRFNLSYDWQKEVLVTVGGSEAIDIAIRVLLNPGEEVIIPQPSFVCYAHSAARSFDLISPVDAVTHILAKVKITLRSSPLMLVYRTQIHP